MFGLATTMSVIKTYDDLRLRIEIHNEKFDLLQKQFRELEHSVKYPFLFNVGDSVGEYIVSERKAILCINKYKVVNVKEKKSLELDEIQLRDLKNTPTKSAEESRDLTIEDFKNYPIRSELMKKFVPEESKPGSKLPSNEEILKQEINNLQQSNRLLKEQVKEMEEKLNTQKNGIVIAPDVKKEDTKGFKPKNF